MSFADGVILSATFASPRETSHARTSLRRLDVDQYFVPVGVLCGESGLNNWTWKRPGFDGDRKPNIWMLKVVETNAFGVESTAPYARSRGTVSA